MQDRYAGDIGDYLKLALLRVAARLGPLGVAWWLFPDEGEKADGQHIGYLHQEMRWRHIDPALFGALREMVSSGSRNVRALEQAAELPGATFYRERCRFDGTPAERRIGRTHWFGRLLDWASDRSIVFVDPDNGIEPKSFSTGSARAGKSVAVSEIVSLAVPTRTLIVYYHQTRMAGGHQIEIGHWRDRLRSEGIKRIDAIRAAPYSPRAFFILNASDDLRQDLKAAVGRWSVPLITWHGDDLS